MRENITLADAKKLNPIGDVPKSLNTKGIEFLNKLLANEYTLFTKTLNYHWNVTGPRFNSLHKFLEEQYQALLVTLDDVAERVRTKGSYPLGTVEQMSQYSSLDETNSKRMSAEQMINDLLKDHLTIQETIKEGLKDRKMLDEDPGTEDFLTGVLQKHEKTSWMLQAQLQ